MLPEQTPATVVKQEEKLTLIDVVLDNTSKKQSPIPKRLLLSHDGAMATIGGFYLKIKKDWLGYINAMGFSPGSDLERSAILILMGFVTQDSRHIRRVTGWPKKWTYDRCARARRCKIWRGRGMLTAQWLDLAAKNDSSADIAFIVDVMVVNGEMEKIGNKYRMTKLDLSIADKHTNQQPQLRPSKLELDRFKDDGNPL
jgi:hypothetical protein